jgi:hypothetical protein
MAVCINTTVNSIDEYSSFYSLVNFIRAHCMGGI